MIRFKIFTNIDWTKPAVVISASNSNFEEHGTKTCAIEAPSDLSELAQFLEIVINRLIEELTNPPEMSI